jgi:sensor histidine kinase regulating citrate/malate metabolism
MNILIIISSIFLGASIGINIILLKFHFSKKINLDVQRFLDREKMKSFEIDEAILSSIGDGVFAIGPTKRIILFNNVAS